VSESTIVQRRWVKGRRLSAPEFANPFSADRS
jgi:hypothetical protein